MIRLMTLLTALTLSVVMVAQSPCEHTTLPRADFDVETRFAKVEVHWYPEWLEKHDGQKIYPDPLPPIEKWDHPHLNNSVPNSMHEDSYVSDVTNNKGPVPDGAEVQYFHVREKGGQFSGLVPSFNFLTEDTLVVLSFGRSKTHLLLIAASDTLKLVDALEVPGREYSPFALLTKKKRMKLFRNTAGGAYSFLGNDRYMHIPGPDNEIYRVPVGNGRFDHERVEKVDLVEQMHRGDFLDDFMDKRSKTNIVTSVMPDANGNVWFTSQHGIVGLIHYSDTHENECPKVYAKMISMIGLIPKLNHNFHTNYESWEDLPYFLRFAKELTPEIREQAREYYHINHSDFEEIQNSIAVGKDGVYVLSDLALHKLWFNEATKEIELHPDWQENFKAGGPLYDNDYQRKPGQLNRGSGSSPTLIDDRFIVITDNDTGQVNLCIFAQEDGALVGKFPLFEHGQSAVENSVVGYGNSIIVANNYGILDPFEVDPTPGGLIRFDYDETTRKFAQKPDWPPYVDYTIDPNMATPKLSTASGLVYVYNRRDTKDDDDEFREFQLTAIDFESGMRVFSIIPYFEEGEFDDTVGGFIRNASLGKDFYDRKVFNNLWSTFSFGPGNTLYSAAFRGFVRYSSDDK